MKRVLLAPTIVIVMAVLALVNRADADLAITLTPDTGGGTKVNWSGTSVATSDGTQTRVVFNFASAFTTAAGPAFDNLGTLTFGTGDSPLGQFGSKRAWFTSSFGAGEFSTTVTNGTTYTTLGEQTYSSSDWAFANHILGVYTPSSSTTENLDFGAVTLTVVPEPTSFVLFGMGVAGLAGRRRRNRSMQVT